MEKYYVVFYRRRDALNNKVSDRAFVLSYEEAVKNCWITEMGDRDWVVPPAVASVCIDFVFEFPTKKSALRFAKGFEHEIGVEDVKVLD